MGRQTDAGDLTQRVSFGKPVHGSDGAGGIIKRYEAQSSVAAAYTHLRGGEAVMAARLAGRHNLVIRVRASIESRRIAVDWIVTDCRTGKVYLVKDVTPTVDRAWIDVLAETAP